MKYTLFHGGYPPKKAHFDDAGYDFRAPTALTLKAHTSAVIDLRVGVQIPIGYFGKLESKSGLNILHNIQCTGGVIDSGYRGHIMVRMTNSSDEEYRFERGDKIVQMVVQPCGHFDLEEVDELDPSESGRDANGYGSTGR